MSNEERLPGGLLVSEYEEIEVAIEENAPDAANLADLARQLDRKLGLGWSEGKWRGIWKHYPELRYRARRRLSKRLRKPPPHTLRIDGDLSIAILSDAQIPYHDKRALALAMRVTEWWNPDVVILAGDIMDCTMLSDFDQNPARHVALQEEAELVQDLILAPLRHRLPDARIIFLPGNHEKRIRKQIWRNPWLYEMTALRLEELMAFERWGIEMAEYEVLFNGNLGVAHGVFVAKVAGYAAKRELEHRAYSYSTITGHVHRSGMVSVPKPGGDRVVGRENPCLCRLDPDWTKAEPRWTQGLTLAKTKTGVVPWISPVDFSPDYRTCAAGKWF